MVNVRTTPLALLLATTAATAAALMSPAVVAQTAPAASVGQTAPAAAQWVDPAGNMHLPTGYRTEYQYFGTWAVAGEEKGSKQLHVVYASPGTAAAYRKDGKFPDGAILVKEVYNAATGVMTTGTVSHADKLLGWFMMVKDSKDSYPNNKLWGNGWGWSWFDAGDPVKTTTKSFRAECLGCHIPAKGTDWIYTSGYPVLK